MCLLITAKIRVKIWLNLEKTFINSLERSYIMMVGEGRIEVFPSPFSPVL
jgi:hypothetical protein